MSDYSILTTRITTARLDEIKKDCHLMRVEDPSKLIIELFNFLVIERNHDVKITGLLTELLVAATPMQGQHDLRRCKLCGEEQLYRQPHTLTHKDGCIIDRIEKELGIS
jgi:hypothetical protein